MSHHPLLNAYVLGFLPEDLDNMVILDVGCGFGEWGFLIRTRKLGSPYLIGVDVWGPYLKKICSYNIYDEFIQVKLPHIPFREKSVDTSLVCEILEHLPKNDGYELVKELEKATRRMIIASSPLEWPQGEIRGNPYERHVSEWTQEDFLKLGFETKVIYMLPKTLRAVDRIRRYIFRLPHFVERLAVGHKKLDRERHISP